MKLLLNFNAMPVLIAVSCCCVVIPARALAQTMHFPTKLPTAKAETVGMSTAGLNHIDEIMQEYIDAGTIQGAITAVARRGKVVHFSTHGEMDVEKARRMEPNAIFIMASSAKAVAGVATMVLIEEGLLSPSDPVSKYIPEFADLQVAVPAEPVKGPATPTSESKGKGKSKGKRKGEIPKHRLVPVDTPLTIHHLLTHTAGLMTNGLGAAVSQVKPRTPEDTRATYVPRLAKVPLDFQPGTQRRYSPNGGITVMTRIIEIVSETPYNEFVQKRILIPLEMNNTYFNVPRDKQSQRVVIKGVDFSKKNEGWGLFSTAEDYLHFQQMLLNGGELFGYRVMSPDAVRMMSSNQVGDIDLTSDPKSRRGMGHGYTVSITLDPELAGNYRGQGAFGGGGAAGTMSWTDPQNEIAAVIMLQQPTRGSVQSDFAKAIQQAIIE